MQGLDFATTRVLLIGASEFPDDPQIVDIPNVAVNIKKLSTLLKDTELMGIPEANITVSLNERKDEVETKLNRIVKATNTKEHTLIVYYTGHGMYSSHNSSFYLATTHTTEEDLEALGVKGDVFKDYIRRSAAGRKIVIFDCCYSGKLLETMDTEESRKVALLNGFAGTYAMASSASDEPSLFPRHEQERPTYFTEKLLEAFSGGLENGNEYCSLNDIFSHIEQALMQDGRPRPLQSVYKTVGEIGVCRNRKFVSELPADEKAWQEALKKNNKLGYTYFIEKFGDSQYVQIAYQTLVQIEDEEKWNSTQKANTIAAMLGYIQTEKQSHYVEEAYKQLNILKDAEREKENSIVQGLSNNENIKVDTKDRGENSSGKSKDFLDELKWVFIKNHRFLKWLFIFFSPPFLFLIIFFIWPELTFKHKTKEKNVNELPTSSIKQIDSVGGIGSYSVESEKKPDYLYKNSPWYKKFITMEEKMILNESNKNWLLARKYAQHALKFLEPVALEEIEYLNRKISIYSKSYASEISPIGLGSEKRELIDSKITKKTSSNLYANDFRFPFGDLIVTKKGVFYGAIDSNGDEKISFIYNKCAPRGDSVYVFWLGSKMHLFNNSGIEIKQ